ncbi:hypothetical protein CAPTEDRAFT_205733 [Capitella teleta]|uniref:Uncharacterized protein n=1 Tax=Capitella teleta TaxID=283909 RepID=R7U4B8_CAPTE|nr:hypothetical protein CAPTEDRAFT_205733 [Capitella teleta]|eukprot:ELT98531.1 hypothetical protein CAPTEDRAFT_205733 [Capitella teleta]
MAGLKRSKCIAFGSDFNLSSSELCNTAMPITHRALNATIREGNNPSDKQCLLRIRLMSAVTVRLIRRVTISASSMQKSPANVAHWKAVAFDGSRADIQLTKQADTAQVASTFWQETVYIMKYHSPDETERRRSEGRYYAMLCWWLKNAYGLLFEGVQSIVACPVFLLVVVTGCAGAQVTGIITPIQSSNTASDQHAISLQWVKCPEMHTN